VLKHFPKEAVLQDTLVIAKTMDETFVLIVSQRCMDILKP
jgi:hypothetical protein